MMLTTMTRPLRAVPLLVLATALLLVLTSAGAFAQATTLTIEGLKAHYHTGDQATLTAVQDPDTGEDHWHWFVRKEGASDFEVVSGELADTYTFTVSADMDGAQVQAKLYDHDHNVIAESDVVTVVIDDHDDHGHDDHGHDDGHGHDEDHDHSDESDVAGGTQGQAPTGGVPAGFGGAATDSPALPGGLVWSVIALLGMVAAIGARPFLNAARR